MGSLINLKIRNYLLDRINKIKNEYDKKLPSENFLATKFKVSRQTARVELVKLCQKGFIKSIKGSGYYINPNIDTVAITSMGENNEYKTKKVIEIDYSYLEKNLSFNLFKLKDNIRDYFGYRKTFYDKNNDALVYINSYILKTRVINYSIDLIKKSLMEVFELNNIKIVEQINKIIIEDCCLDDQIIFKCNDNEIIPTVYGILVSKDNEIIEIFERRYKKKSFELMFSKKL